MAQNMEHMNGKTNEQLFQTISGANPVRKSNHMLDFPSFLQSESSVEIVTVQIFWAFSPEIYNS